MLWMKAWLETRWRLLYAIAIPLLALGFRFTQGLNSVADVNGMMSAVMVFCMFPAVYLAGAGIRTQAGFQGSKGLSGSTYYTLSLPVSRSRLFAVRAGAGFLEAAAINLILCCIAWAFFPLVRANSTALDLVELIATTISCTALFYFISVLLSTFLEDTWQLFGSMFVIGLLWWLTAWLSLPPSASPFQFMSSSASPLITHEIPWPAIGISFALSALLLSAALKIVQTREF